MKTSIYLIRHGEVHNPDGIHYVRLPHFGLSKKGEKEMQQTAAFLVDKNITEIYASPLLRTQQSARIIQNHLGIPRLYTDESIIEIKSSYQGKYFADLDALQSLSYTKPLDKSDETMQQIADRMMRFIKVLILNYPGKHIAVVSHGDPLMLIRAVINNQTLDVPTVKGGKYIQHGEIFLLTDEDDNQTIKSIFQPTSMVE